jgi:hypothetical protein
MQVRWFSTKARLAPWSIIALLSESLAHVHRGTGCDAPPSPWLVLLAPQSEVDEATTPPPATLSNLIPSTRPYDEERHYTLTVPGTYSFRVTYRY